jgi:hypothetical protein
MGIKRLAAFGPPGFGLLIEKAGSQKTENPYHWPNIRQIAGAFATVISIPANLIRVGYSPSAVRTNPEMVNSGMND